jgi:hypothetical protein
MSRAAAVLACEITARELLDPDAVFDEAPALAQSRQLVEGGSFVAAVEISEPPVSTDGVICRREGFGGQHRRGVARPTACPASIGFVIEPKLCFSEVAP